jgi:apolipoprotein N-acyltransferase
LKQITKNNLVIFGLLPFILGLLTSLSLPPYNLILINFITFPSLLFIVFELKNSKKKAKVFFKVGWLFGFGYFLSNLYWITYSLTHDDIFKIFIPFALISIPAFLAIFYGLSTLLLFKFDSNKKITLILIFSLIF